MSAIRLAVIVPTYGNWADCLDSLRLLAAQDATAFTVILADDGAVASPPPAILDLPFVNYLRLPHSGFATTCNAAARTAISSGATHLLFLNDDTAFGIRFISAWLEKIREIPSAIMGPMIYYYDRPEEVWFSGGRRSVVVPFIRCRTKAVAQKPVDILTACALVVPCEAWNHLGGFDESFITYYEDFDLLLRARQSGIPVLLVTEKDLEVLHKVSRTTGRNGPWSREYRMIASRLLFIRRRYVGCEKALCMVLAVPHLLATCIRYLPALPHARHLWNAISQGFEMGSRGSACKPPMADGFTPEAAASLNRLHHSSSWDR